VEQPVVNRNGYILEAYAEEGGLRVLGPQLPTHMTRKTGTMDVLDIAVLKNICLPTAIEALNELSSD
jgi:hypothetical protein